MTVSSSDAHVDLIDGEAPGAVRRRPSLLAAAVAVVLAAGALVVQATKSKDAATTAPEDMSGSLMLTDFRSTGVSSPFEDRQERNAYGSGRISLTPLMGGRLDGLAEVRFSGSFQGPDIPADGEPASAHLWGDITFTFGSNACQGSFAWSSFTTPPERGGSVHARCEDGAAFAASVTGIRLEAPQHLFVDLRDGWYVAGPAKDD